MRECRNNQRKHAIPGLDGQGGNKRSERGVGGDDKQTISKPPSGGQGQRSQLTTHTWRRRASDSSLAKGVGTAGLHIPRAREERNVCFCCFILKKPSCTTTRPARTGRRRRSYFPH